MGLFLGPLGCGTDRSVCPSMGRRFITSLCLLAYSAKQEFLFLTAAPDAGRSLRETHFPEELKVGTARPRH